MPNSCNGLSQFLSLFDDFSVFDALEISIEYSNTKNVCYCEKSNRLTDEKYILNISENIVNISCSGKKSAFYALCDIYSRLKENTLTNGEFICSPSFETRGYIEGFYGNPWSDTSRKSVLKLMACQRMNTVYYAPKDDLYHREKWKEKYPEEKLSELKSLLYTANAYFMSFYWCIAPGLSIKYTDENDFYCLKEKTRQMYSIGIRHFGLLLDDIDEELSDKNDRAVYKETVNAHIDLIQKYHSFLTELDFSNKLTVCPTVYHGKGNEYYISKLGQNISPLIDIFWTGRDICSRDLTSLEAISFMGNTHHKPLYWDNYPVNDCSMHNEMHISPLINRDKDLWKYSGGLISNCMEYAECSKIPLLTVADYLWDSENYNPQKSWERAIKKVVGEENAEYFIVFADHLFTSCLQDSNSRRMYEVLDKVQTAFNEKDEITAARILSEYIQKMKKCRLFLEKDLAICNELKKWSEKFFVLCELFENIFLYITGKDEKKKEKILSLAQKYISLPAKISNDINILGELKDSLNIDSTLTEVLL